MKSKAIIAGVLMFLFSGVANAQTEVAEFLQAGKADGQLLIKAFMMPLSNVVGSGLNTGWYNTAAVQKKYGFGLSLTVNAAMVPEANRNFDIATLGMTKAKLLSASNSVAPSIAGENVKGPTVQLFGRHPVTTQNIELMRFETPKGGGYPTFPLPAIKASFGLPLGIELMGRYLPKITYSNVSLTSWGAGLKLDVMQFLPFHDKIPFINASVMGAYSSAKSQSNLDFQKTYFNNYHGRIIPGGQSNYTGQTMDILANGMVASLMVSLDVPVLTVYGALGYGTSTFGLDLLGTYPVIDLDAQGNLIVKDEKDPVKIDYDKYSGLQYTAGLRLKFSIFTINADYTIGNYPTASAGLGLLFNQK